MVRPLLVALVLCTGAARAEDLLTAPIGTTVTHSFELDGKLVPLPDGTFQLAARNINEPAMLEGSAASPRPKVAHVILVSFRPPRLRAAVHARTPIKAERYQGRNWVGEPCKKEGALYRADLTGSHGEDENCLLVDHSVGNLGPRAQGIVREAADWLAAQGVQLPVPVLITAHVTRFQNTQLLGASYSFNPRMYGCNAPMSRSYAESPWNKKNVDADPQRVRFVESVITWGKLVQTHFDAVVASKSSSVENARPIYNCTAALALTRAP